MRKNHDNRHVYMLNEYICMIDWDIHVRSSWWRYSYESKIASLARYLLMHSPHYARLTNVKTTIQTLYAYIITSWRCKSDSMIDHVFTMHIVHFGNRSLLYVNNFVFSKRIEPTWEGFAFILPEICCYLDFLSCILGYLQDQYLNFQIQHILCFNYN